MKLKEEEEKGDGGGGEGKSKPAAATAPPTLFIVNVSKLTDGAVHNKHDKARNNNPGEVGRIRREIEADWEGFGKNGEHVSSGVVIPCGGSVWKDALAQLRDEHPGEFFLPVFKRLK